MTAGDQLVSGSTLGAERLEERVEAPWDEEECEEVGGGGEEEDGWRCRVAVVGEERHEALEMGREERRMKGACPSTIVQVLSDPSTSAFPRTRPHMAGDKKTLTHIKRAPVQRREEKPLPIQARLSYRVAPQILSSKAGSRWCHRRKSFRSADSSLSRVTSLLLGKALIGILASKRCETKPD